MRSTMLLMLAVWAVIIVGEVKCIYKAINCNWEPVGKAELVYTIGIFTPVGFIIGYIDIEDK